MSTGSDQAHDPTDTDTAAPSNGIVSITHTTTLKTRAWKSGLAPGNITTGVYTLQVPTPVLSKASGTYFTDQSVTVTNTGSGVTMRYTTNGSTPTTSDPTIT
jgi:hypothetical protein